MDEAVSDQDYLPAFDNDLGAALSLVVDDRLTAGIDEREADDLVWSAAQERLDALGPQAEGRAQSA